MNPKLLALSAAASALLVSACSSTSPNPPPPLPNPNGNALVLQSGGQTQRANAYVSGNENQAQVVVGDRSYRFSGGRHEGTAYGINAYSYSSGNISDPNGAAIFAGSYVGAAAVADNTSNPSRTVFVVGGEETQVLPNQAATYDGLWTLVDSQGNGTEGVFRADADFDARQFDLNLRDGTDTTQYGAGTGTISGNGFTSQFNTNTNSGMASTNRANGQFYGPNAEEIGGLVAGETARGNSTAGMMIGSKR